MAMMCRGFRGATTVSENTEAAIAEATEEMLRALVEVNGLEPEYIAAAWFTTTPDLNASFPATVARRQLGWTGVALMNSHEINVPGGLPMCIRVMLLVNTEKSQDEIQNVYLRGAVNLRQRDGRDS
ncbi:MAG: chorismate mutase [Chloroflexota bacterium]|nr:chorismate mutase [Chloroflexota bacterium]MDE2969771.1 chorismate mutase [Chloroflexota bacterium]